MSQSKSSIPNHDVLSQWCNADHWRKLCPYLRISENGVADGEGCNAEVCKGGDKSNRNEKMLLGRLVDDGYALIDSAICSDTLRTKVGRGISELEIKHTLPATFSLLFDETWRLAAESRNILLQNNEKSQNKKGILQHGNTMAFNFDMLAWHIDPRLDQSGFSPHRDRQPDSTMALEQSFYDDGQAKYITHWIALADATPENSCLYVIPKQFDPGYLEGDDPPEEDVNNNSNGKGATSKDDELFSDPLSRALRTKHSYQNIRALPRQAGQSLIFTHRILHWGSRGNPRALNIQPRIALSFVYSDVEFEAPYLSEEAFAEGNSNGKHTNYPPFSIRLLLVCAQLLIYYQRFSLPTSTLRACYDYCKSNSDKLQEDYRKKVFVEYVKAMKERRDGVPDQKDGNAGDSANENEDDAANSEDEEALLEEMLNNSGEFEDDYDDVLCNDGGGGGRESVRKRRKYNK